jgi:hypothetical protein
MRTQPTKIIGALLIAGLLTLPSLVQAQPTAHYVPGSEGIKAATLPPPGIWLRDYNAFYYSDQLNDTKGNKNAAADAKAFVYANVPRLLWITDTKVLDGYLGMDALLPLVYTELKANTPGGPFHDQTFGVGDLFFEGTWSSHLKQWDLALGVGVWAPTGDTQTENPTYAGKGNWGEMLTAGATWYPDQEKRWALSVLNRYEFNQQQEDTSTPITPGQAYTVEGGLSYGITKTIDVGAVGYYQQQVTGDTGTAAMQRAHGRVAAIGPEVSAFFPSMMLGVSLRYEYEFLAESRLQGNTVTLTLTKKF